VELVDTTDSKSVAPGVCRFKSGQRYQLFCKLYW